MRRAPSVSCAPLAVVFAFMGLLFSHDARAQAAPRAQLLADQMTVSGREELPTAGQTRFANRLLLSSVVADPATLKAIGGKPEDATEALRLAVDRTLRNHGYAGAAEGPDTIPVIARISAPTFATEAKKHVMGGVSISLETVQADSKTIDEGQSECLPITSDGQFKALYRLQSGAFERVLKFGVIGALALQGIAATGLATDMVETTPGKYTMLNRARVVGLGEGVAPAQGERGATIHAAHGATRMALRSMIMHLGNAPACIAVPAPNRAN